MAGITPWNPTDISFNSDSNASFITNNSSSFERDGNYIKCKFKGKVLLFRQISHNKNYEVDIPDELGGIVDIIGGKNQSICIIDVDVNDLLYFKISLGDDNIQIYNARLIAIRLQ